MSDLGLDPDLGSRTVFRLRLRLEHLLRRFCFWEKSDLLGGERDVENKENTRPIQVLTDESLQSIHKVQLNVNKKVLPGKLDSVNVNNREPQNLECNEVDITNADPFIFIQA